jgi:catechol 2,3-dioxygenase
LLRAIRSRKRSTSTNAQVRNVGAIWLYRPFGGAEVFGVGPQIPDKAEALHFVEFIMSLQPETPSGLNHLVLNVRDLDRAHRFWTEYLGFRHVGTFENANGRARFYSGEKDGKLRHHDIALFENPSMPEELGAHPQVFNHVAITYPSRISWQRQIRFLQEKDVTVTNQVARGATHSVDLVDPDGNEIELVYEHPRAEWEGDINAAINRAVPEPVGS